MKTQLEYVWLDGGNPDDPLGPTKKLRSKTKILDLAPGATINDLNQIPSWGFDGSSTWQAGTDNSDCALVPVAMIKDPLRKGDDFIVLCEVYDVESGQPHASNTRAPLTKACERYAQQEPLFGFEQEYTLMQEGAPFRWPKLGAPSRAQGGYYCGVGYDELYGSAFKETYTRVCIDADLMLSGTNAEVMPAQWEFQIGPLPPLAACDQLWLARYLMYRVGEQFELYATLDPKPRSGDWNGAGMHTNFSTKKMRDEDGLVAIKKACRQLEERHAEAIALYGFGNELRLTGRHETCDISTFRCGIGDRGASVRIPAQVAKEGCGYLEDRRPAANADPYEVANVILQTICG